MQSFPETQTPEIVCKPTLPTTCRLCVDEDLVCSGWLGAHGEILG